MLPDSPKKFAPSALKSGCFNVEGSGWGVLTTANKTDKKKSN